MSAIDWQPTAAITALQQRAAALARARDFFRRRNILEVETPILGRYSVTDPHIASIRTASDEPGSNDWLLRTSPEYHMKRLLAAGSPDIFQIGKVFRAGESGTHHQPEFTMIEWYRLGFGLEQLVRETCELIRELCLPGLELPGSPERISYSAAFRDAVGIDPLRADLRQLHNTTLELLSDELDQDICRAAGNDRNLCLDLLASHRVFPALPRDVLVVVDDYPAEQAQLSRVNPSDPGLAMRFEIFLNGTELANGFHELADAREQRERFAADRHHREVAGLPDMEADQLLLAALESGLPDCSGVALGLDRLLMLANQHPSIDETLSFRPGN